MKRLLPVGVVLLVVLAVGLGWSLVGSDTDVLDVANPTDEQIRRIVALLTTDDSDLYMRVEEKIPGRSSHRSVAG